MIKTSQMGAKTSKPEGKMSETHNWAENQHKQAKSITPVAKI